jgi:RecA/RadA recombinase
MSRNMTAQERKQKLRALMNSFNTDFAKGKGHKVMAFADEVSNPYFLRRPCGIMQLDIDTGGGLPAGGVSVLSGPDNSGKTFLLNKYMAQHQRLYGASSCLGLATVEGNPDYFFMRKCGVQVAVPDEMIEERAKWRKIRDLPPFTKDELKAFKYQVGDFIVIREATGELLFDAILESVRRNIFGIIGLDSISMIQANAEAKTNGFEQMPQQAADAGLITRFYKKYFPLTLGLDDSQNETTLIFTSQVRSNRKKSETAAWNPQMARSMKDFEAGGAYAGRHGKLIEVAVWSGAKDKEEQTIDGKKVKIQQGKTIMWEIRKGKAGTHDGITGEVNFSYDDLTDDLRSIIVAGLRKGVMVEKNGLLTLNNADTGEPTALAGIPGPDDFCKRLQGDFQLELAARREVLAASGIQCTYL